jgi:hypothetical protein
VASYHASFSAFPHQSTAEQWFDESQTESYRMLGQHTIDEIFHGWNRDGSLRNLREYVEAAYLGVEPPVAVVAKTAQQAG